MNLRSNNPSEQAWVPVVSSIGQPLMPCSPKRARLLVLKGKAIKKFLKGFFYIKLTQRATGDTQPVVLGIDPGSKMEGYTVKSAKHTFLNLQSHARDGKAIQKALEARKNARRVRRQCNTPYRECRPNRAKSKGWIPPSTKARWQLKYNIFLTLAKLYPISTVIIEDVKAITKDGKKHWNTSFSPVQCGKNWLYSKLEATGIELIKAQGTDTYNMRQVLGLQKTKNKLSFGFDAHCVDSWVLANSITKGHLAPENTYVHRLTPLTYARRQLHVFNPSKGNLRRRYGGTTTYGIKKGTMLQHPKYGTCLLGGYSLKTGISLHTPLTGTRLTQNAKLEDTKRIAYAPWVIHHMVTPVSIKMEYTAARLAASQLRHHKEIYHASSRTM